MDRQGDRKSGALSLSAFGGDVTVVAVYYTAANRESDAGALVFSAPMQSLKDREHFVHVLLIKADAVIANGDFAKRLA
jgi:hypothetical protein